MAYGSYGLQISPINQLQRQQSDAYYQRQAQQQQPTYSGPAMQIATPNNPYPGHSNFPYPGETGTQAYERMKKEWEVRGMQALPDEWDAQRAGGGGNFGLDPQSNPMNNPAVSGMFRLPDGSVVNKQGANVTQVYTPSGGLANNPDQELEEQRRLAFQALAQQRDFYDRNPMAQAVGQSLMAQLGGAGDAQIDAMAQARMANAADTYAAGAASDADLIRQQAARSGVSGGVTNSEIARQRNRSRTRALKERSQISAARDYEKLNRREQARREAGAYLAQQAATRAQAVGQEVGLRSRFEITGDAGYNQLANAMAAGNAQQIGGRGALTTPGTTRTATGGVNHNAPGTGGASYGGVTYLDGANMQPWRQTSGGTRGTSFGLNLANYTNYAPGTTDRNYGPSYVGPNTVMGGSDAARTAYLGTDPTWTTQGRPSTGFQASRVNGGFQANRSSY